MNYLSTMFLHSIDYYIVKLKKAVKNIKLIAISN